MRILAACSLGGAGHLNPLLPFLDAAQQRGDQIMVLGPPAIGEMVARAGYAFRPGGEPSESEVSAIREQLPVLPAAEASILGNRELFGRLATRAMLPETNRMFGTWKPDLVLRDPTEYASAVLACRMRTPSAQVAISLADGEVASISAAAPALEEHQRGLVDALFAMPYLTRFPRSLDPSSFSGTIRYRESAATDSTEPLPDWWGQRKDPLIYMSFGTVLGHMSEAADFYRLALKAIEGVPARVLLTVGLKLDMESLGYIPDNVHVETWIDQTRLLDDAALVVCHGGSGTALGALAAGVPVVVVPLFADQFENGRRIAAAGAGRIAWDDRRDKTSWVVSDDAARIADAVNTVLTDDAYRGQARIIAKEMAAAPSADEVLDGLRPGA